MSETWKPIPGYEGLYEVSDTGQVRQRTYRILKQEHHKSGYRRVALTKNRSEKHRLVHRLVALAFIGDPPPRYQVNHRDGQREHNTVENLEYATAQENILHSFRVLNNPPHHFGEKTHWAKLIDADVIQIRRMRNEGMTYKDIAAHFNTKPANVWHICTGRTWKHLLHS